MTIQPKFILLFTLSILEYSSPFISSAFSAESVIVYTVNDVTLTQANDLIKAGETSKAYDLLEPLESVHAGEVNFDYLLGVAAIESGHTTRGVFALERVLAIEPNNIAARAMIGKGYFKLGEFDTSKQELATAMNQTPNADLKHTIDQYMSAIDKSLDLTTTYNAFLEGGVGWDSNISSATSASSVNATIIANGPLIPFTLTKNSREQSSHYMEYAAGATVRRPFNQQFAVFGSIGLRGRTNWANDIFDTRSLDLALGASYKYLANKFSMTVQNNQFDVASNTFRRAWGLTTQWQNDIDDRNQVSVYLQSNWYEYPQGHARDADRHVLGLGYGHGFGGDKAPVIFASIYAGREQADDHDFDFLSNDIVGAKVGGQMTFHYKLVGFASASYEQRKYDGKDLAFGIKRDDDQYELSVGLRYLPGYQWTIKPQVSYIKNDSNNAFFEFDRTVVGVNFRHDFKW